MGDTSFAKDQVKSVSGLTDEAESKIVNALAKVLANAFALYVNTLSCHWNLEDARFLFLHEMLESQYKELAENNDAIAERIRQMGRKVPASLKFFYEVSELNDITPSFSGDKMLEYLAKAYDKIICDLRAVIAISEDYKDFGLTDLLSSQLRHYEKTCWMIKSHL